MSKKTESSKNIGHLLRKNAIAIGAVAVSLPGVVAKPAAAQTGGTEAPTAPPVTVSSPSGGIEAPSATLPTADQLLNAQAQQAQSDLAKQFMRLSNNRNTTQTPLLDAQGDNLTSTTIAVPAKDSKGRNDGQYEFNIVSLAGPNGEPQLDDVYSVTASEGLKPTKNGDQKPPEASIRIGQNPGNNTAEVGATYHVYPSRGAAVSSEGNYKSIAAGVQSVAPGALQPLTAGELGAVETQMSSLAESATQGQAIHRLEPAFNQQGFTINDPAN